ncbi:hypothetical protein ACHAO3_009222 [Verticillium nonalfalfae]
MGQRHQLFVIARVGNYYRPLAAIHHQWLYGVSALRSCRRLLRIFSDPSNRIALKHELYLAVDFFQKRGPPPSDPPECEDPERTACPFPFITTYLAVGAAYDFDLGRVDTIHELAFDTGFDQGDNNDGITVLDITDLVDVRYCFVNLFEYLKGYYDVTSEMVQNNIAIIEGLEKSPLVETKALSGILIPRA